MQRPLKRAGGLLQKKCAWISTVEHPKGWRQQHRNALSSLFSVMPPTHSQSVHTVQNRSLENTRNSPKSMFPYKTKPGVSVYDVPSAFLFLAEVFFPPFLVLFPYLASSWAKKFSISFSRSLFRLWGGGKEHQQTQTFPNFNSKV